MPIYIGSDKGVKEFKGFDVSPNGKYWGSRPIDNNGNFIEYPLQTRQERRKEERYRNKFMK